MLSIGSVYTLAKVADNRKTSPHDSFAVSVMRAVEYAKVNYRVSLVDDDGNLLSFDEVDKQLQLQ